MNSCRIGDGWEVGEGDLEKRAQNDSCFYLLPGAGGGTIYGAGEPARGQFRGRHDGLWVPEGAPNRQLAKQMWSSEGKSGYRRTFETLPRIGGNQSQDRG